MAKTVAVLALFMTGEALTVPFAPLFALPFVPLMKPLTVFRTAERILAVLFIPAAAVTALSASYRFAVYTAETSLHKTPLWIITILTITAAVYNAFGGADSLRKWAGFTLPLTIGFILLAALLLAGKLQSSAYTVPRVWERCPFILACEGITLLGLIPALKIRSKPIFPYLTALLTAGGIGAAVWTLCTFTLGSHRLEGMSHPFYIALRIAKGGEIIGRVEAFLLPVLLCVTVLKAAACLTVITHGVKAYMPQAKD
jgi:hypothetical protein